MNKTRSESTRIEWRGDPKRIDMVMVEGGLAASRNQAGDLISRSLVSRNGSPVSKPSHRVQTGDTVEVLDSKVYVSRAAQKLVTALELFGVDPLGKFCLDVGASTGGFTQVLLEKGAEQVVALDVGHGQLAEIIREDERVVVVERFNARYLSESDMQKFFGQNRSLDLLVSDVSFISLTHLMEAFSAVSGPKTDVIVLVKPQFEVGVENVNEGVVTDPGLHESAIRRVLAGATEAGFFCRGLTGSPVLGSNGNREFLMHMSKQKPGNQPEWNETIKETAWNGDR